MTAAWPERQLGEICVFNYGKALPATQRSGEGFPVYGSNGEVGRHEVALTDGPTIIVGRKGSFGEVHLSSRPCWPIDTTYFIDENSTEADLRWLAYRLRALGLTGLNRAAAVPGLNREDAYRQRLLVPPIEEQRRIAGVLDQADELRTRRQGSLGLFDSLSGSIFLDMFGNPASNPRQHPVRPLADVVAPGTVVTYGIVQAGPEYPGGVPYIRTGDIVDGRVAPDQLRRTDPEIAEKFARSRVSTGEIVMSIRATVGTTASVPPELDGANLTQGTARIAPGPETDASYLLTFLRTSAAQRWISRQVKGATFREITLKRLRELPVMVPPLPEQRAFARRLSTLRDNEAVAEASRQKMCELFASLQQRAFAGRL